MAQILQAMTYIIKILSSIVVCGIIYLGVSAMHWNFNPGNWKPMHRECAFALMSIISLLIITDKKKTEDHESD